MEELRLVDLHCHILPELDDGAESMHEAVAMARMAAEAGTREIVCTPHCTCGDPLLPARLRTILERTAELDRILAREHIRLRVHPGMELLCSSSPGPMLAEGEFLTLSRSRYLLIEFPFEIRSSAIASAAETVSRTGLRPIIAHPERYVCVRHSPELLFGWAERGWLLQLNRGSITGSFGREVFEAADWILSHALAHFVASDAHGTEQRTPDLADGYRYVAARTSPSYADRLFRINPRRVLADRPVVPSR